MPATTASLPPRSALQNLLNTQTPTPLETPHPAYLHHLATTILQNLQFQHDWTSLTLHSTLTKLPLPRPLISGLPPRRAYIHPDEQVEILKAEHDTGESIAQFPEREWVLPTHLEEKWSLARFAEVFDAVGTVPEGKGAEGRNESAEGKNVVGAKWQGENRQKRILLATLHDDSTVVYYIMHDGIVKPRQN
ncbi:hypothetical protein EAF04_000496 [Stromatinia cepivora]|nr:hypothetical protein EAF04_000496 [Stromatinia cepivora]